LLKKRGLYAQMWNRQREAEEVRRRLADIEHEEGKTPKIESGKSAEVMSDSVN